MHEEYGKAPYKRYETSVQHNDGSNALAHGGLHGRGNYRHPLRLLRQDNGGGQWRIVVRNAALAMIVATGISMERR